MLNCSFAKITMERPSGVSSDKEENWAASANSSTVTPSAGTKLVAILLPSVIVPVLSSKSTSTSPAASMALPLVAITFRCKSLSMPLIPMALSRPPIVVGIRQTSKAIKTGKVRF